MYVSPKFSAIETFAYVNLQTVVLFLESIVKHIYNIYYVCYTLILILVLEVFLWLQDQNVPENLFLEHY